MVLHRRTGRLAGRGESRHGRRWPCRWGRRRRRRGSHGSRLKRRRKRLHHRRRRRRMHGRRSLKRGRRRRRSRWGRRRLDGRCGRWRRLRARCGRRSRRRGRARVCVQICPEFLDSLHRRRDHIDGSGELAALNQVVRRSGGQPPSHFGRQVARRVVHRKHMQQYLRARGGLRRPKDLRLTFMSEALQLIFLIKAHDQRTAPPLRRRPAGASSSNAFIFQRLREVGVVS